MNKKFKTFLDTLLDTNELPPYQPPLPAEQLLVNDESSFQSLVAHTACVMNIALEAGAKVWNRLGNPEVQSVFMPNGSYLHTKD